VDTQKAFTKEVTVWPGKEVLCKAKLSVGSGFPGESRDSGRISELGNCADWALCPRRCSPALSRGGRHLLAPACYALSPGRTDVRIGPGALGSWLARD
jgi:hypothetical protein